MEIYRYCKVQPEGSRNTYYYIANQDVQVGAEVLFPFGVQRHIRKGVIVDAYYTDEDAPFPVNQLRPIFEASPTALPEGEHDEALEQTYIDMELAREDAYEMDFDNECLMEWAMEHHNDITRPAIMKKVVQVYEDQLYRGEHLAGVQLASLYATRTYLEQDLEKAEQLYEDAAKNGDEKALCQPGLNCYYGTGHEVDLKKAYDLFNRGGVLFNDAHCLYKLGDMYWNGDYVDRDHEVGMTFYFRAFEIADAAVSVDLPHINLRIGRGFLTSDTIDKNVPRAHLHLVYALSGFYRNRSQDMHVSEHIRETKELLAECERILDNEIL